MLLAAIAQMVGIVMLSNQLSNDHHLQAVIPRVPNCYSQNIEAHTPFIAFFASDYISSKGWTVTGFAPINRMLWIPLNGERLTFKPIYNSSGGVVLQQNQSVADVDLNADLGLPRLKTMCCTTGGLRPDFTPQASGVNPMLAAIADFPTNHVSLVCKGTDKGRVDTQIAFRPSDAIAIIGDANGTTKELRLNGNATFYIANLTSAFVAGGPMSESPDHYQVYYQMLATSQACLDWRQCAVQGGAPCKSSGLRLARGATIASPPDTDFDRWAKEVDVNCSNSQYP